jgi:hypothetical protein
MTFSTFCCFLVVVVAEMAHGATLVRGLAQATKSDLVLVDAASAASAGTAIANTQASQSLGPNEEVPIGTISTTNSRLICIAGLLVG